MQECAMSTTSEPKKVKRTTKAKGSQSRVPPWRRAAGPVLSIVRDNQRLKLDFVYGPERVKAIKALPGARYHPDDKSWSTPLEALSSILALKEFPPTTLLNGLGPIETTPVANAEALAELRRDPFAVREEVIAALPLDLIIRYNAEKRRIKLIPRVGSTAERVIKRVPGALFSAFDTAYVAPVEQLSHLLKKLRDKQVVFAVDSVAGAALAGSSALRREILARPERASAEELASALLTPFITTAHGEALAFRPCYFTTEQFKVAFPGVRRQAGRIFTLDERGLLQFIGRAKSLPFPVWLSSETHEFIERKREQLAAEVDHTSGVVDDVAVDLIDVKLLWRTVSLSGQTSREHLGRAALVVQLPEESEVRGLLVARLGEVVGCTYASEGDTLILEVPDSKLLMAIGEVETLCEVHGLPLIPKSESFVALESDVRERTKTLERSVYYGSLDNIEPEHVSGLNLEQSGRLFPHQRVAVQWLQEMPYAFLGDDMGLGKTLSVLSYFAAVKQSAEFSMLLVVCPNSLSRNWAREVKMWFPELRATVLSGDRASKAWALRLLAAGSVEFDVLIVNYEGVRLEYVTPELERLAGSRKTLLCLDESQRVKNPSAKTFKAISQIAPACDRRVLLSGTPTPKDVSDLWAQMRILDGGKRFGKSFYKWLSQVAELGTEYSQYAVKKFHDAEVAESIHRAHEVMLRRRKERVVDLPPKTFSIREVELSGSQAERYDEIREGLILRMRSLSGEQFFREITNILEEYLRAVQVSSNPRLIDPEWKGEPAKFLELDEIVHEVVHEQGQKIVIWSNYLLNIRELCERYKAFGASPFSGEVSADDRERTVRAFQEGNEVKILVAVPAAGGVGITLTAAQTAVYVDKTWNAEHWMQSVDRIHRIGQRGTVNVISLLGSKVDEIIHWNLRRKEQGQAKVLGDYQTPGEHGHFGITREELLEALDG
jgi:SWI/SNF-related matrix-associated actin-dependent regulator 1 of chromatin subfamily A